MHGTHLASLVEEMFLELNAATEKRASGSSPATCGPAEASQRLCQETGLAEDGRVLSAGRRRGGRRQWKTRLETR